MGWTVRGSNPGRSKSIFSSLKLSRPALGPIKLPGHEVDHSLPSSPEEKSERSYTPTPLHDLKALTGTIIIIIIIIIHV